MIRRTFTLLLCAMLAALWLLPAAATAEEAAKVVRVGWYETPFNHKDSFGRRTGYAYEYQRKIAAYTGWKYEYIEGNWSELLGMLKNGEIDLMSDISWTEERAEQMLYADIPMGEELYYLYISPYCNNIFIDNFASLNGKKVGVTGSSVQKDLFLRWAEIRGITVELQELECSEEESLAMLQKGKIDAFVTLDTYGDPELAIPLWKIGASDFFFAVSKDRQDLLTELNNALNRIQEENKFYSEQLSAKYLRDSGTNRYLTTEELNWLNAHGPIRVGYQDHYLAFCAADPETGELTGALKDYLEFAAGTMENAYPQFEAICYPTATAALEALKNGEVDCMFPANLTDYDGEQAGIVMTPALMRTEMDAVVREADRKDFLRRVQTRVGVNKGNPNYEKFLVEHFPTWTPVTYDDTPTCLKAVAEKNIDCVIVSNYRYSDIAWQCDKLNLTTVYTGVDLDYSLAVREGNTTLYSILSRIISQVPEATVNAALTYYSSGSQKPGFFEYLLQNPMMTVLGAVCIALVAVVLVLLIRMAGKRQKKSPGKTIPRTE